MREARPFPGWPGLSAAVAEPFNTTEGQPLTPSPQIIRGLLRPMMIIPHRNHSFPDVTRARRDMSDCYRCGQEGHRRRDCPEVIPLPPAPRPEGGAEHGQDATLYRFPAAAPLLAANAAREVDAAGWAGKIRQTMDGTWFGRPLPSRAYLTETDIARWSLRGQFRTRDTFGLPHPGDFRGGLPLPAEYPVRSSS